MSKTKLLNRFIIPTYDDESYVKFGKVEIDREKCNGCGMCKIPRMRSE